MSYYVTYREDGTLEALFQSEEELPSEFFGAAQLWCGVSDKLAKLIEQDIDSYTFDELTHQPRKRNEAEMRARVREIYNRVKSGELHRVLNDLIEQYKHFFTSEELEEVELPEQKVRRLEARLKALETKLRWRG